MLSHFSIISLAALADSINPCAASVLFLTLGFLISLNLPRQKILHIGGLYITGIFIAYILIGLGILGSLSFFGIPKAVSNIGGIILIITSLITLVSEYIPKFPIKLTIPDFIKPKIAVEMYRATLVSSLFMGFIVGLFEFPCTGGPYLFILSLLHDSTTFSSGALYLFYYNLIFILPLVAILMAGSNPYLTEKLSLWRKKHAKTSNIVSSLVTLALGLIIIF